MFHHRLGDTSKSDDKYAPELSVASTPPNVSPAKNVGLDNPEYHMMNGTPVHALNGALPSQLQQSRRKINSSDDDTDHEYYNDYDKLKRELQPLNHRRSETTV